MRCVVAVGAGLFWTNKEAAMSILAKLSEAEMLLMLTSGPLHPLPI